MISNTYGVLQSYQSVSKRDLLFFDRIVTLDSYHPHALMHDPPEDQAEAEYDFLVGQGVIESAPTSLDELFTESQAKEFEVQHLVDQRRRLREWEAEGPQWTFGRPPPVDSPLPGRYAQQAREKVHLSESGMKARLFSLLRSSDTETYTPILRTEVEGFVKSDGAEALKVVLEAVPVPADDVSLEELLDFKASARALDSLKQLRRWMRRQALDAPVVPDRLSQEIQDLLSDYREHMRLAKMKASDARLQLLVSAPAATVERLVKLQLSQLFDPIFEFRRINIQLLEAELKAPGRQLAYLQDVADKLGALLRT